MAIVEAMAEIELGPLSAIDDPGCREFRIGEGDWPFRGFVVRRGEAVFAYENRCPHAGHPLNWAADRFLTPDEDAIICASHGALFDMTSGDCLGGPCNGRGLRRLCVAVRGGVVYVTGPVDAVL